MSEETLSSAGVLSDDEAMIVMHMMGDEARKMMLASNGSAARTKEDGSPVTEVDGAINRYVIEQVALRYPGVGVLGEEETLESDSSSLFVVDPIDGTASYSIGLGVACFSIAYVVDGVTRGAVMDDPFTSTRFSVQLGKGAYCNGEKLELGAEPRSNIVLFEAMRSSGLDEVGLFSALRTTGANPVRYLAFVGPSARVASGALAGALFGRVTPWDYLGVALLVQEAGGVARDFFGRDVRGLDAQGGIIIAHRTWYDRLRNVVDISWY